MMFRPLPPTAVILGLAGLIPFAILGLAAVGGGVDSSFKAAIGLVAYSAIILAFLGGVHWGFTLNEEGDGETVRTRLGLAVIPTLVGLAAILCGVFNYPVLGLGLMVAGFIGLLVAEFRAQAHDIMPSGYLAMRTVLSVIVVAILVAVMVVRSIGGHVLM
jgi:hypothetical protein